MQKIKYGPVEIVVRRATVGDDIHSQIINAKLQQGVPSETWGIWQTFVDLCGQTVKAKGLPFDPTALHNADKRAVDAAYDCFVGMDKAFKDLWKKAADLANAPIDEALGPVALADDADPN